MNSPTDRADPLLVGISDGVATVTINDAPLNRMTLEFMDRLEALIPELAADDAVGAIVFTAAGTKNFSVGMNLKELLPGIKAKGGMDELFDQRLAVLSSIEHLSKPAIATMFGNCLGGGLELPLACHFRLAAETGASIGLPELDLGTLPAWGGTPRLARCVGRDHALDMILRAKKLDGPEAKRIGLVSEVWPLKDLLDQAQALGAELAAMPRASVAGVLRTVVAADDATLSEGLQAERQAVHETFDSADAAEGMTAFLEKRKPQFGK